VGGEYGAPPMRRYLILLFMLGTLLVGACGGGDDNSGNDNAAGTSEEGSDDANNDDTDFSGQGSDDFCDKARVLNDDDSLDNPDASPEETREDARRVIDALDGLAEDAPGEIEDDINMLLEALRPVFQAIADGKDLENLTPEEQAEFERLQSPEFEAAGNRFNAYVEKVCGIDADEDGDTDGVDNSSDGTDTTGDTTADTTEDTTGE
jgi:hypothetical protein